MICKKRLCTNNINKCNISIISVRFISFINNNDFTGYKINFSGVTRINSIW